MDKVLRENLLAPYLEPITIGGIRYFRGLPWDTLRELIENHLVEMGPWNECPGVAKAFGPFMARYPGYQAHGYVVDAGRPDARITVEGIEKTSRLTREEIISFVVMFKGADDLQIADDYACCWYD